MMYLTKVRKLALNKLIKLSDKWHTAEYIGEQVSTLDALVRMGKAERRERIGPTAFYSKVHFDYRLLKDWEGYTEAQIIDILDATFPENEWDVRQGTLTFRIIAKSGIVLYVVDMLRSEMLNDTDIKEAGSEAVAGLADAVRRHLKSGV